MKMKLRIPKRILSLALALVLVVGMMPAMSLTAYAAVTKTVTIANLTYTLTVTSGSVNNIGLNQQNTSRNGNTVKMWNITLYGLGTGFSCEFTDADCSNALSVNKTFSSNSGTAVVTITRSAASHTGGICTSQKCTRCGSSYAVACDSYGSWVSDGTYHWKVCTRNSSHTSDKVKCSGGTATCIEKATCSTCGNKYGDYGAHSWSGWHIVYVANGNDMRHYRVCNRSSCDAVDGPYNCTFNGTPNCSTTVYCTQGCGNKKTAPNDHDWGNWVSNGDGTHTRTCSRNAGHTETKACSGSSTAVNCTVSGTCTTCNGRYNTDSHNYTYATSGSTISETCANGCDHSVTATLTASNQTYTGSPITTGASIAYGNGWAGDKPQPAANDYSNNTNAGTATVTTTVEGKELTTTFQISVKELTSNMVTLSPASGTYTGTAVTQPTVTVADGTAMTANDYTVTWPDGADWTNAGTITVTVKGQNNYAGTVTKDFVIGKGTPTKELFQFELPQNAIYDGNTRYSANVTSNASGLGAFTVKYNGSTDAPKNAGTYKVTVDVAVGSNYNAASGIELDSFTIDPIAGSITIPANQALTYDGAPVEYTDLNPTITADGQLTVTWYDSEGAPMNNAPTNVGTYQVGISAAVGNNYNAVDEVRQTFTITKKELTITAKAQTITYGESIATDTAQVGAEGLAGGDTVTDITLNTEDTNVTESGTITASGAVIMDGTENVTDNYQITYKTGTLTIDAKAMTATANGYTGTYDGIAHTITVTPSESGATVKYGTVEGTYNLTEAPTYTNAGTYTVYYEVTKDNYTTVTGSAEVKINPVAITVTVDAIADQTYTGSPITPAVTITPEEGKLVGEDTLVQDRDYKVSYSDNTDVGTAAVTISAVTGSNYAVSGSGSFKIVQAARTVTIEENQSVTYDGGAIQKTDITYTYPGKDTAGENTETVKWYSDNGGTIGNEIQAPTDAGTYWIGVSVSVGKNYQAAELVQQKFTIAKAPLTITAKKQEVIYGTQITSSTEQVDVTGLVNNETLTDITLTASRSDVGTGTITPSAAEVSSSADNYAITYNTGVLTVKAKELTVTADEVMSNVTWNGSAHTPKPTLSAEGMANDETLTENRDYTLTWTDNTNVGMATVKVEATGNYSFTTIEKTFLIVPDESLIAGLTTENVTSADKTNVDKAVEMMKNADMDDAPEEDKEAWEALKSKANALQDEIEAADAADQTQNIQDAEGINANNVKLDQKQDLEDALKDLEDAKDTYSDNYTPEEKAALDAEIKRIEDALAAIERVEDFNTAIDNSLLAEDVKTDMDADTEQAIKDAQAAYNALSDHEKTLIDPADKTKLDTLVATITAYKITKGDGGRYTVGSGKTLSFTANGPVRKFDYVQVNGKTIAASNYTVAEGGTVITLKSSYLDKLGYGKHKIQIFYTDGSTDVANFRIYVNGGNPFTGDNSHMMLFGGVAMVSLLCMAMMVMFISRKKGKYER